MKCGSCTKSIDNISLIYNSYHTKCKVCGDKYQYHLCSFWCDLVSIVDYDDYDDYIGNCDSCIRQRVIDDILSS